MIIHKLSFFVLCVSLVILTIRSPYHHWWYNKNNVFKDFTPRRTFKTKLISNNNLKLKLYKNKLELNLKKKCVPRLHYKKPINLLLWPKGASATVPINLLYKIVTPTFIVTSWKILYRIYCHFICITSMKKKKPLDVFSPFFSNSYLIMRCNNFNHSNMSFEFLFIIITNNKWKIISPII